MCLGVVYKVAVQIYIVFVCTPQMGKAVRVDGMNHHQPNVWEQRLCEPLMKKAGLNGGTGKSLDAVSART